jgi:transposase-like protein
MPQASYDKWFRKNTLQRAQEREERLRAPIGEQIAVKLLEAEKAIKEALWKQPPPPPPANAMATDPPPEDKTTEVTVKEVTPEPEPPQQSLLLEDVDDMAGDKKYPEDFKKKVVADILIARAGTRGDGAVEAVIKRAGVSPSTAFRWVEDMHGPATTKRQPLEGPLTTTTVLSSPVNKRPAPANAATLSRAIAKASGEKGHGTAFWMQAIKALRSARENKRSEEDALAPFDVKAGHVVIKAKKLGEYMPPADTSYRSLPRTHLDEPTKIEHVRKWRESGLTPYAYLKSIGNPKGLTEAALKKLDEAYPSRVIGHRPHKKPAAPSSVRYGADARAAAIKAFEAGEVNNAPIAQQVGAPATSVAWWRKQWKAGGGRAIGPLTKKRGGRPPGSLNAGMAKLRDEAMSALARGESHSEVAARMGIPSSTLSHWKHSAPPAAAELPRALQPRPARQQREAPAPMALTELMPPVAQKGQNAVALLNMQNMTLRAVLGMVALKYGINLTKELTLLGGDES